MFGSGLIKGLKITIIRFFDKKVTEKYPEVKPALPARSHGSFDFFAGKCIACGLCADACPNRVIRVEFHKNEQGKRTLDNYSMNLGYCMFCKLCTEACPTNALVTKPDFELAAFGKKDAVFSWAGNTGENAAEPNTDAVDETAAGQ